MIFEMSACNRVVINSQKLNRLVSWLKNLIVISVNFIINLRELKRWFFFLKLRYKVSRYSSSEL